VSLLIGDCWGPGRWNGSQGGLVAVGIRLIEQEWEQAVGQEWDRLWLKAIKAGAYSHLDLETRLREFALSTGDLLTERQRRGRMRSLLLFAMTRPFITSGDVVKRFGMARGSAIRLLKQAAAEGHLAEIVIRENHSRYRIPVEDSLALRARAQPADENHGCDTNSA